MEQTFFIPFGIRSGLFAHYIDDYELTKYPNGVHSMSTHNSNRLYVTKTLKEYPSGPPPRNVITFIDAALGEPDDLKIDKANEVYRIVHPLNVLNLEDLEPFSEKFSRYNEIYYVPLNAAFFNKPKWLPGENWSEWLLTFIEWVGFMRKSAVIHATEIVPVLPNLHMLRNMPNIYIFQSHTTWNILNGVLTYDGPKF